MANEKTTVAVLGLGSMGFPMAKNLAKVGFRLRVWNRTIERARKHLSDLANAELRETPREAVQDADIILVSLANDQAVRSTVFGEDGVLAGMKQEAVHLEATTISFALSQELTDAYAKQGRAFVASPVFGRPDVAETAKLRIAAGGPKDARDRAMPIFKAISQEVFPFDTAPQASLMKICGNLMIAATIEMLGEALTLGEKGGIAPGDAMKVISAVFGSPVVTGYGDRIASGKFIPAGFKLNLGLKDVSLAMQSGDQLRVPVPLANLMHDHMLAAINRSGENVDWAAMTTVLREQAGLDDQRK